ncbi:type I-E CRISPR-associated protein Cse2/CasB [Streptomyces sp. NPDC059063]|uniref:type I-E CRISPR-associated protein Cse2/CasB n=1 Tax=unclassified Streptomyces TaxID=2593676 RepID=UPI00367B70A9
MTTQTTTDRAAAKRQRLLAYTQWTEQLCREEPGARSALRSGLRRSVNDRQTQRMHRFIAPWLPENSLGAGAEQRAYYAVAAMIAAQPRSGSATTDASKPLTEHDTGGATAAGPAAESAAEPAAKPKEPQRYGRSLGMAFATAVTSGPGREKAMRESTAEARLNLLTRQSIDGLHRHLPAAVGYLRGLDVPVDWAQLLSDLIAWPDHCGSISRRWLQDYYRQRSADAREQANHSDLEEAAREETDQPEADG